MLLAVNVGNSNTVLGVFRGPELERQWRLSTETERTADELAVLFAGLLDQGFALIAPYYTPHRQAVLEAEGKLAAALAPYAQKLVSSPLGGCVVELQAALLEDSTPAKAVARKG